MRDLPYEAAVLRAGLLVGLVHERDVPGWAEEALGVQPALDRALAAVATTRPELSAMRAVLQTFASTDEPRVADAVLVAIEWSAWGEVADVLRVLSDLRRFLRCRPAVHDGIRDFDARMLMVSGGTPGATLPGRHELISWIAATRRPARFLVPTPGRAEAAAFVAAVSRAAARASQPDAPRPRAWIAGASPGHPVVVLDETAWAAASTLAGAVPFASRIPYVGEPAPGEGQPVELDRVVAAADVGAQWWS